MANYYQIFGIKPDANLQEIKAAYKKLALKHHPDRNPNDPQAEENFKHINEIYQTLSDEYKRMAYDYLLLYQNQQIIQTNYTHTPHHGTAQHYTQNTNHTTQNTQTPASTIPNRVKFNILVITFLGLLTVAILGFVLYRFSKMNNEKNMLKTAHQYAKEQKPLQAINLLNSLIETNHTQMDAILLRAKLWIDLQNHWQAIQDINKLLSDAKYTTAEVYFLKGKSLFFLYNFEEAIKNFEEAINLDNTQAIYHGFLAIAQKKQQLDKKIICQNWKKAQGTHENFYFEEMQEFCQ